MRYFDTLYLDKEKDIAIEFFEEKNSFYYVLKTPNNVTDNLICNLAKLCNLPISVDENGKKVVKGKIPSFVNEQNQRIHILKFASKTVAVINTKNEILPRASIPAISKTLMSQTTDYKLSLDKTLIRTYIEEDYKFVTDVHTHMNASLHPDALIALGIYHQIKYPYYYVKKLKLKLTASQEKKLETMRKKVEKEYKDSSLVGKYRQRRIDDNTYINFADLILNNINNAAYNINKVRASLTILKDGQAVFTNLEKLYLYRYVFTKGVECKNKIKLKNTNRIPDKEVKDYLERMLLDASNDNYKNNTLLQDKLLWIGRSYRNQGIKYVEISNTTLVKNSDEMFDFLDQAHYILPLVEKETGVKIRFLAALRRIPLTIIKDNVTPENYLRENLDVLKAVCLDPYVVGSDFVGEEINDICELKPVIKELVDYARVNPYFTIRIHAGENDSLIDNVYNSVICVRQSLNKGQRMPKLRIGHGLYTPNLNSKSGKKLISEIKRSKVMLEFQITSNVRLNNLNSLESHPFKAYLSKGVMCLQGTDGCGIYGTDSLDEQLALMNLLKLSKEDMAKIVKTEKMIIDYDKKTFKAKQKRFNDLMHGRSLKETLQEQIELNKEKSQKLTLNTVNKLLASEVFKNQIKKMPSDKHPIVLAGGSFSSEKRSVKLLSFEKKLIDRMLETLSPDKFFFVVGHKITGYEKYLIDHNKNFEIFAIVPSDISKQEKARLLKANISLRVSTESLGMGIYKSFNYEIFERRPSTLIALEGNSAGANLVQEAKNGKGGSLIFVSKNSKSLYTKAQSLQGYVNVVSIEKDIDKLLRLTKKNSKRVFIER